MQISRNQIYKKIESALRRSPVCLLLGPRQSGKTWLARQFSPKPENYFDLENLIDLRRLEADPQGQLARLYGLVVIDEAQRMPELFPILRYLADRPDNAARFLLLGSAAPQLVRGVSESLAGRAAYVDMAGFSVGEINSSELETLWVQGGFPLAFLQNAEDSFHWRLDYLRTLIEQDLRDLATLRVSSSVLRRLLLVLAQANGQTWNHSTAGQLLSLDYKTVQRYIELLEGTFLIRQLPPFERNLNKRLRKAPKIYFRDAGLAHALLSIRTYKELSTHMLLGASWEAFALEQVIRTFHLREDECFTYSVHSGPEMDLVVERSGTCYGFEFKSSATPKITSSMTRTQRDLNLQRIFVISPGKQSYELSDTIEVIALPDLPERGKQWEITENTSY